MSAPPKYRLLYFDIRVLGDHIRFLFHYAGVPFEDVVIEDFGKEWEAMKDSTGWGKLPILEIDGKEQLSQSSAIAKYLARQFNMDGATVLESAKCDEYNGVLMDARGEWRKYWFETDEVKKQNAKKVFETVAAPHYLSKFNKILESNNGNGGRYLVGNSLTWADLLFAVFLELWEDTVDKNILKPWPILSTYKNQIYSVPQIKKAIENRPPYKY